MHLQQAVKCRAKFLKSIAVPFYIKGKKNLLHIAQNKQYKAVKKKSYKYQRFASNNSMKKSNSQTKNSTVA